MPGSRFTEAVRREQVIAAANALAVEGGLQAITIRDVATRAKMSTGLVLFHFTRKEQLLLELLDWVLATTTALRVGEDILAIDSPLDRLIALLTQEMHRLTSEPARIQVFFEFWGAGLRDPGIRGRMQPELDRYRAAFLPIAADVIRAEPERFANTTAEALAAVAVSIVKGCAVQSLIEPTLNLTEFLATAERLLRGSTGKPAVAARTVRTRRPPASRPRP